MTETEGLHPVLAKDCYLIGQLPLCKLLLMNDMQYPWCILVPKAKNVSEIYQLDSSDQNQLIMESSLLGQCLMQTYKGDKLNIGALGNIVPQLHIHHIVRYENDPAWPGPVWGHCPASPYPEDLKNSRIVEIRRALGSKIDLTWLD